MNNQLIKVGKSNFGGEVIDTVDARELHAFLEVGKRFATWITDRIDQYNFSEGVDYTVLPNSGKAQPCGLAANRKEYALTLDMAKELSMVERNEKGQQARQYFIRCEKELLSQSSAPAIPQDFAAALRLAADTYEKLLLSQQREAASQALIEAQRPDVEFVEKITHDPSTYSVAEAAKSIGTGEARLYKFMREAKWVNGKNEPYQSKVSSGMLSYTRGRYEGSDGQLKPSYTARVTEKGKKRLFELIKKEKPQILDSYRATSKAYREASGK